ncbi:hypothetical protein ACIRFH_07025 [Streptomyces sp. NPDC093586]|uniref:hypothetical protein n=1 Tax=Streptomyces sp. NPDC093586 TaxID=3366042 RepID=UPI003807BB2E
MRDYLSEAAEILRRADRANESERYPNDDLRLRIARQFAELAAVERGQLPASVVEMILDRVRGAA